MKKLTMYDSVSLAEIPGDAQAVAGYVNGRWPTYPILEARFPHAKRISIAVTANRDAECLDVERWDATPDQASAWVKRQLARGVKKPVVYTSVSEAPLLLSELRRHGLKRKQFRLWTAHYSHEHLCDRSCGFGFFDKADATQWTNHAHGKNLDASLCSPGFFGKPPIHKRIVRKIDPRRWKRWGKI